MKTGAVLIVFAVVVYGVLGQNACSSAPCMNGATCAYNSTTDSYGCTCAAGYTGANCQTNIDDCATNPCTNGGTCLDGVNKYTCSCPAGYDPATLCAQPTTYCPPAHTNPCHYGGQCNNTFGDFQCTCSVPLFTGHDCSALNCSNTGTAYGWVLNFCGCPVPITADVNTAIGICTPLFCTFNSACFATFGLIVNTCVNDINTPPADKARFTAFQAILPSVAASCAGGAGSTGPGLPGTACSGTVTCASGTSCSPNTNKCGKPRGAACTSGSQCYSGVCSATQTCFDNASLRNAPSYMVMIAVAFIAAFFTRL